MIMGNPVIHFEIGCSDQASARKFYEACFDWKLTSSENMDEVDTKSDLGINGHITSLVTEIDHYVTFYIQVDDVAESLKKIENEGGKTIVPPIQLPDGRTFAWFNDVSGNTLGIITN